jgi:pyruvate/2-oxoglutarate dehydrogenase complex dihydrolipoamide dehydrogenase (E3) component
MEKFDAIIIGSGQAGNPLARRLSKEGKRVALIEFALIGGTCINYGCTPTKTLVEIAKEIFQAHHIVQYGPKPNIGTIEYAAVRNKKDKIVSDFRNGLENSLQKDPNITIFKGKARFTGYKEIEIDINDQGKIQITSDLIFINTGARPHIPNIEGLQTTSLYTSKTILEINTIPKDLLIIGGGYISLEFAQIFHRLGSNVTIVEKSSRLLKKEDQDVATELGSILESEGIQIITDATINRVSQQEAQVVRIDISILGKSRLLTGTHLLIATGRVPNTEDLDLSKTGITVTDGGFIPVKGNLETKIDGIYALGDVKGGPAFTHVSYHDYIIVSKNLLEKKKLSIHDRLIPYCIFTDPELGRIGLTESEAMDRGLKFSVAKMDTSLIARAVESGQTTGFIKAIIDDESKMILGAAVICPAGGELMSLIQMAMLGGITYDQLHETMFAHPTYAESLNNLFRPGNIQPQLSLLAEDSGNINNIGNES